MVLRTSSSTRVETIALQAAPVPLVLVPRVPALHLLIRLLLRLLTISHRPLLRLPRRLVAPRMAAIHLKPATRLGATTHPKAMEPETLRILPPLQTLLQTLLLRTLLLLRSHPLLSLHTRPPRIIIPLLPRLHLPLRTETTMALLPTEIIIRRRQFFPFVLFIPNLTPRFFTAIRQVTMTRKWILKTLNLHCQLGAFSYLTILFPKLLSCCDIRTRPCKKRSQKKRQVVASRHFKRHFDHEHHH